MEENSKAPNADAPKPWNQVRVGIWITFGSFVLGLATCLFMGPFDNMLSVLGVITGAIWYVAARETSKEDRPLWRLLTIVAAALSVIGAAAVPWACHHAERDFLNVGNWPDYWAYHDEFKYAVFFLFSSVAAFVIVRTLRWIDIHIHPTPLATKI